MADLLWDVPQTNGSILCCRQKYVPGGVGAQAPDRSVHVSIYQDVARCIFLSDFDDLCVPGAHQDFTLTQQQAERVRIHMWQMSSSIMLLIAVSSGTNLPSADRANTVYDLSGL